MKYLKLVNVPLSIFSRIKGRYGDSIPGSGKIPWVAMGFNSMVTQSRAVQYRDKESTITYLPVVDEDRVKATLKLLKEDIKDLLDSPSASIVDKEHGSLVALRDAARAK